MNNVDNILNTNEVFIPPKDNENQLQSLFKIYLEIALRKAALASLSSSIYNNNNNLTMEQQISNSQKNSVNIPPVSSIPSPLSGPYQYSATTPTSSSIPLTNSHNLRTSSFKLGQNVINEKKIFY